MSAFDDLSTAVHPDAECDGCALATAASRRDFLREAAVTAAGLLLLLGARPAEAARAPLRFIAALGAGTDGVRYPLPAQDGVEIDAVHDVILVRHQSAIYAFARACPHQHVALRWQETEGRFQCPKHKSRYQPDGVFIEGRATRGLDRFAVTLEGSSLVVDLDRLYREDKHSAQWKDAFVTLAAAEK